MTRFAFTRAEGDWGDDFTDDETIGASGDIGKGMRPASSEGREKSGGMRPQMGELALRT